MTYLKPVFFRAHGQSDLNKKNVYSFIPETTSATASSLFFRN